MASKMLALQSGTQSWDRRRPRLQAFRFGTLTNAMIIQLEKPRSSSRRRNRRWQARRLRSSLGRNRRERRRLACKASRFGTLTSVVNIQLEKSQSTSHRRNRRPQAGTLALQSGTHAFRKAFSDVSEAFRTVGGRTFAFGGLMRHYTRLPSGGDLQL